MSQTLELILTALASSLITVGILAWYFQRVLLPRLERDFERLLRAATAELGREVEERVKRGVLEGVAAIPSAEMLQQTTRTVAQTGVDLVGAGLNSLLGRKRS